VAFREKAAQAFGRADQLRRDWDLARYSAQLNRATLINTDHLSNEMVIEWRSGKTGRG
jgi:hypothetical protein